MKQSPTRPNRQSATLLTSISSELELKQSVECRKVSEGSETFLDYPLRGRKRQRMTAS